MLKKLRRRFVLSAIAAVSAVLAVLIFGINMWNYVVTTERTDNTLAMFADHDGQQPPDDHGKPFGGGSPEMRYMMRYFTVSADADGNITASNVDFVRSVTSEQAEEYARNILESGREKGSIGEYRYLVRSADDGSRLVFLNISQEQGFMRTLLIVSCGVGVICLVAVGILVAVFSRRAIEPYIRNIEQQKRFITDAGHELKTPITAISASADVLDMEVPGNEWVGNIRRQSERLSKLVKELVMLSRLSEEKPFRERTEFSLSDAVWEIAEAFSMTARANRKQFTQDIDNDVNIVGDMDAFQKLTSILLDNALKYSDPDSVIRLSLKRYGRRTELSVVNKCTGIDSRELPHFFDRFYRSDKSRNSPGSGLGLAAAKEIAEAHGGKISANILGEDQVIFKVIL